MNQKPAYWSQACRELSRGDRVMADLIREYKSSYLSGGRNAFTTLCRAIVGQQISVQAADSVWSKLQGKTGGVSPQSIAQCRRDVLSRCGLSRGKVEYLKQVSEFFISHKITARYWYKDIEVLRSEVLGIKGVGVWTFEMFAIFYLQHSDILPLGDLGLINAMNKLYNQGRSLEKDAIIKISKRWAPWRTVATWYLWRSIDPKPIVY